MNSGKLSIVKIKKKMKGGENMKNYTMYTSKEIAELSPYNITHHHVTDRLQLGWSIEKIINTPLQKKK